jgi:hypothetical protein
MPAQRFGERQAWVMRKFKRFKGHKVRASQFLQRLAKEQRALFAHWDIGMTGVFNSWEPDAPRGSCPVLREARGDIPRAYSPDHKRGVFIVQIFA